MGAALELLTGFVTAPGATLTALTMAAGNSLAVRNCDMTKKVTLLETWTHNQVAGIWRVRSPKMHDNVQGIRFRANAADVAPLLPWGVGQKLYPQDVLTAELSGSGVAGQIETACMLLWYEDLPGANARLIGMDELMRRGVNQLTVETSHVAGVAGGYSGQVALNSSFDLLKANTDYALLGFTTNLKSAAVRWLGADVANLGIGAPGNDTLRHVTCEWFLRLQQRWNIPLIPVFNSANKSGILVDVAQNQAGGTSVVNSVFVELAPAAAR
jgi:hypothetical protein